MFGATFKVYLADYRELPPGDMKAIDAQREDSSQSHHAAHCSYVVKVRLRVLNVPGAKTEIHTFVEITIYTPLNHNIKTRYRF